MDWLLWILAVPALVTALMLLGFYGFQARVWWGNRARPRRALTPAETDVLAPFFDDLDLSRVVLVENASVRHCLSRFSRAIRHGDST